MAMGRDSIMVGKSYRLSEGPIGGGFWNTVKCRAGGDAAVSLV